jgi:type II secretory pathway pseudopilin PulG
MLIINDPSRRLKGFSLIEAMVATAVMGFGLMAIATFHTKLVSGSAENKTRLEALSLAEEKVEEFRSETTRPNFNSALVDGSDANPIQGVNAEFTRSWEVDQTGKYYDVDVSVAWENRVGDPDSVSLSTTLIYEDPTLSANAIEQDLTPQVNSPTGKAILGEGTYDGDSATTNDDGMKEDTTDTDRLLIDGDNNIVLTLQEACNVDGVCSDFVKISGTIYFDTGNLGNNYDYDSVFVIASDAAYCNRYVTEGTGDDEETYFLSDAPNGLMETSTGDYKYYKYTCYLGGGWNGNIGVVMNDPSQKDIACVGDPSIAVGDPEGPELAIRRAYRGMTYKIAQDENGDSVPIIDEDTGMKIYQTAGIKDGAVLPEAGEAGHDFVVTQLNKNSTAADCGSAANGQVSEGPLTRDDAVNARLFSGVPGDFVCLNPDKIAFDEEEDGDVLAYDDYCPYDPTDPPAEAHTINVDVDIASVRDETHLEYFRLKTSDTAWHMPSTCTETASSDTDNGDGTIDRSMDYECLYFTWDDEDGNPIGWNGDVEVSFRDADHEVVDLDISCDPSVKSFTNASSDLSAQFSCDDGYQSEISAMFSVQGNREIATVSVSTLLPSAEQKTGPSCKVTNSSFNCSTGLYVNDLESWRGEVDIAPTNGYVCPVGSRTGSGWEIFTRADGSAWVSISGLAATSNLDLTGQLEIRNKSCL